MDEFITGLYKIMLQGMIVVLAIVFYIFIYFNWLCFFFKDGIYSYLIVRAILYRRCFPGRSCICSFLYFMNNSGAKKYD